MNKRSLWEKPDLKRDKEFQNQRFVSRETKVPCWWENETRKSGVCLVIPLRLKFDSCQLVWQHSHFLPCLNAIMVYRRVFLDFLFFVQSLDGNKTLTTKLYSCNVSNWFSFEAERKNTFQPIRAHQLGKVLVYSTKLFTKPFNFTITIKWVSSERSRNNWKVGQFEKSFLSLVIVKGLQLMRWKDKLVPRILHLKDERSWELGWSKPNRHERLREFKRRPMKKCY